jgi:UDP-2,3-diacylglucosamine pyrophosphatase LpxH
MRQDRESVDTLLASDWHLGSKECEAKIIVAMLDHFLYKRLVLVGDIFDGLDLRGMSRSHFKVLKRMAHASASGCDVVRISGNHDPEFADLSAALGGKPITEEYQWEYRGKKYLAIHGDQFEKGRPRAHPEVTHTVYEGALAYAQRRGVDYIICGHVHSLKARSKNGRFYYNAGSGTHRPVTCITIGEKNIRAHKFFGSKGVKIEVKQLPCIETQ